METKKVLTGKKHLQAVICGEQIIVKHLDGSFSLYDADSTSVFIPTSDRCTEELCKLIEFNEQPFVDFLNEVNTKKKEKEIAEKLAKEASDKKFKEDILSCETPGELADLLGLKVVEVAQHWSDLYEGRSTYGVEIFSKEEAYNMELAKDLLNIDGDFCELTNRAGEHHHTSNSVFNLEAYQENVRNYLLDKNFHNSQEESEENYLEEIRSADSMDDVEKLVEEFKGIEDGIYDCNGNLIICDKAINSDDFTSYGYDVYSYQFGFRFGFKYSFQEPDETDEE